MKHIHFYTNSSIICISLIVAVSFFSSDSAAETGSGMPLKYIASCELDFNADDKPDIAFLVETIRARELIVLMKTANGYNVFVVSKGKADMHLSCNFGKSIKETSAGSGTGKVYETPGSYIQLSQPEASSVVYYWNKNKSRFQEVWTSD